MCAGAGEAVSWRTIKAKGKQWGKAILGTLAGAGIWWAAFVAVQPSVTLPPLPIVACGVDRWVTTAAYTTTIAGVTLAIPDNFTNDLASLGPLDKPLGIPRDHPSIRRAALVHDWGYRTHLYPRETMDWLLWQGCLEDGMEPAKAQAVYEAVTLWGWKAWGR